MLLGIRLRGGLGALGLGGVLVVMVGREVGRAVRERVDMGEGIWGASCNVGGMVECN
jgi:hypothetical protein